MQVPAASPKPETINPKLAKRRRSSKTLSRHGALERGLGFRVHGLEFEGTNWGFLEHGGLC